MKQKKQMATLGHQFILKSITMAHTTIKPNYCEIQMKLYINYYNTPKKNCTL